MTLKYKDSSPYSIFANHRPVRAGFLIDTTEFNPGSESFEKLLDGIIDYNHMAWGGRTNPIVCFAGDSLTEQDWKLLEAVDTDCIMSFGNALNPKLLKELDERLQPWDVQQVESVERGWSADWRIMVPPTSENARRFAGKALALFVFPPGCEALLQRFFLRNFGIYPQWIDGRNAIRFAEPFETALDHLAFEECRIKDRHSVSQVLARLVGTVYGEPHNPPVPFFTPSQLTSIHLGEGWPRSEYSHTYQLIIGDSANELMEHWNSVFWKSTWARPYASHLWVPTALAEDPVIQEGLRQWLWFFTGAGSSEAKTVEFISHTMVLERLEKVRSSICNGTPMSPRGVIRSAEVEDRRKKEFERSRVNGIGMTGSRVSGSIRLSAHSTSEVFSLSKPNVLENETNPDGVWMVDVSIEQNQELWRNVREQNWWLAPRRNSGGLVRWIFEAPARVNAHGTFSVKIENRSQAYTRHTKPELRIRLPVGREVVRSLIVHTQNQTATTNDPRYEWRYAEGGVEHVQISEKGRHLQALLRLFGSLDTAQAFCERAFWRQIFARLASRDTRKDDALRTDISNLLRKKLGDSLSAERPHKLASRILGLVQGRTTGTALRYSDLANERELLAKTSSEPKINCLQGDTLVSRNIVPLSADEMLQGLNELVELNILRPGVMLRCGFCGVRRWYHVDELSQEVQCNGCGHNQSIGAQQEWAYGLNSVAHASVIQGQLGVLQALGALARSCRTSFFFSPNLELFRKRNEAAWHEVDVLAVADGVNLRAKPARDLRVRIGHF